MKIFISYSSKTRSIVENLADALTVIDHVVWFDRELDREGGHPWWKLILTEIRQCDVFLYALTTHSINSAPCQAEYKYAMQLNKAILPVVLTNDVLVTQLPIRLQELQLVDYRQQTAKQLLILRDTLRNLTPNPLPSVLPAEPDAPFAPLVQLNNRVLADSLDPDSQWTLVNDLENAFLDEENNAEAMRLLNLFRRRTDLTLKVSKKLDRLLNTPVGVASRTPVPINPSSSRTPLTQSNPGISNEPPLGTMRHDRKGVEQVYVPSGTFLMGSNPQNDRNAPDDEKPAHSVRITRGFWLDRYPVSNAEYQLFVEDDGYHKQAFWTHEGWLWRQSDRANGAPYDYEGFTEPEQPRVGINWFEAMAYASWRGSRLPTEAEWEYAARGTKASIYPWGDTYDQTRILNVGQRIVSKTTLVNHYPDGVSWCGAFDMAGNVWEWVADWYGFHYYQTKPVDNPTGPESGSVKVVRGYFWAQDMISSRAAARYSRDPYNRYNTVGVRLVSPFIPPKNG